MLLISLLQCLLCINFGVFIGILFIVGLLLLTSVRIIIFGVEACTRASECISRMGLIQTGHQFSAPYIGGNPRQV